MVSPAITVVAQPALEMGRRAAALLLRRLADPLQPAIERLQPTLVVRGSTGPPKSLQIGAGTNFLDHVRLCGFVVTP